MHENRVLGVHGTVLFLCASTCIQDAFPGPQQVCISLPKTIVLCVSWWTHLEDLVCLKKSNETGSSTIRGCLGHMGTVLFCVRAYASRTLLLDHSKCA